MKKANKEHNETRLVIRKMMTELYLFRASTNDIYGMSLDEIDKIIAETAREEKERIENMSPHELANEMLMTMLSAVDMEALTKEE